MKDEQSYMNVIYDVYQAPVQRLETGQSYNVLSN